MKETNREILNEFMAERSEAKKLAVRRYIISMVEAVPINQFALPHYPEKLRPIRPPSDLLKVQYEQLTNGLNMFYSEARQRTFYERQIEQFITDSTNLHFETNTWIGGRNFDFFFDSIGGDVCEEYGERFKGLAIEVDGPIHNTQAKMGKDLTKQELLHSLDIAMITIENIDVNHQQITQLCQSLKEAPRLDSRARGRVRRKVYLETILSRSDDDILSSIFDCDFKGLTKEIKKRSKQDSCLKVEIGLIQPGGSLIIEEKEWLNSDQAANYVGVSKASLLNLASQGKVKYYKFGRRNRYRTDDLKELLLAQPRGGSNGNQI